MVLFKVLVCFNQDVTFCSDPFSTERQKRVAPQQPHKQAPNFLVLCVASFSTTVYFEVGHMTIPKTVGGHNPAPLELEPSYSQFNIEIICSG